MKELEALEIVRKELIKCHRLPNEARYDELDIIEIALNRLEGQDQIINTIKKTIEFDIKEPEIEVKENGEISLLSKIGMTLRKDLNEKERKLFRDWILKECFPEELKALEIVKDKRVDVCYFMNCRTLEEYNDDVLASYAYEEDDAEQRMLTQEEYDILREVFK